MREVGRIDLYTFVRYDRVLAVDYERVTG